MVKKKDTGSTSSSHATPTKVKSISKKNKKTVRRKYRLQAKNLFLTFPQCPLYPKDVLRIISIKVKKYGLKSILVSRERHKTGELHIHCVLLLEKVLETENLRFFDITIEDQISLLKEKLQIKFNPLFLLKEVGDNYFIDDENLSYGSLDKELSSKIYLEALKENKNWLESSNFKNTQESFEFFQQRVPNMIFEPIQTLNPKKEPEETSTNEKQESPEILNTGSIRSQNINLIFPKTTELAENNLYENRLIDIPNLVTTPLNFVDYHGNYQNAKKIKEVVNYCTKNLFINNPLDYRDDFIVMGTLEKSLGEYFNFLPLSERMIAVAEQGKIDLALEMLKEENPDLFTTKSMSIRRNLEDMYIRKKAKDKTYPLESFLLTEELEYFLKVFEMSIDAEEAKVLVLIGAAGTGRTQFAKAYVEQRLRRKPLLINHREGLAQFINGYHGAIIYDDPDFSEESFQTLIRILDNQVAPLKIRYVNVVVPFNTPKLITSNIPLTSINEGFFDEALQRRILCCDIGTHKLFDIDNTLRIAQDPDQIKMLKKKKQLAVEFRKAKMLEREISKKRGLTEVPFFDQEGGE